MSYLTAFVLGIVFEGILYGTHPSRVFFPGTRVLTPDVGAGVFIPLVFTAGYVQWQKRLRRDGINKVMVFATVFYGVAITMVGCVPCDLRRVLLTNPGQHWVFTFLHGLHGVLFLPPGEDMETFFQDTSKPLVVGGAALLQVEVLVGYWVMVSTIAPVRESGRHPYPTDLQAVSHLREKSGHLHRAFHRLAWILGFVNPNPHELSFLTIPTVAATIPGSTIEVARSSGGTALRPWATVSISIAVL